MIQLNYYVSTPLPPPSLELQIHTPTPVTVQHHIFKEEISSNLQVQEDVPGGKKTVPMEDSDVQEGDQVQVLCEHGTVNTDTVEDNPNPNLRTG